MKAFKRILSLVLCACMMCTSAYAYKIIDIDENKAFSEELKQKEQVSEWAKSEIEQARAAGLITENTMFYMTRDITRAQFAELVVNMVEKAQKQEITPLPSGRFTDCDDLAIRKAAAAGIVNGMSETTFAPNQTTNREQIATMVARAIAYMEEASGEDMTPSAGSIDKFTDKGQVSSWAVNGVGLLAANGIMNGTSATKLSPKNPCTVEQSILLILRVYNLT